MLVLQHAAEWLIPNTLHVNMNMEKEGKALAFSEVGVKQE